MVFVVGRWWWFLRTTKEDGNKVSIAARPMSNVAGPTKERKSACSRKDETRMRRRLCWRWAEGIEARIRDKVGLVNKRQAGVLSYEGTVKAEVH